MNRNILQTAFLLLLFFFSYQVIAQQNKIVVKETIVVKDTIISVDTVNYKNLSLMEFFVAEAPEFQTFMEALNVSQIKATLESNGPFTLFVPSNVAFTNLPYGNIDELLKPQNTDTLRKLITYHILPGSFTLPLLIKAIKEKGGEFSVQTIGEAADLKFIIKEGNVYVKDAHGTSNLLATPIECKNGVIYKMESLLFPK